jgi:hypothetical protein
MRSVFVFPRADLERVKRELTRLARVERDGKWLIDAADPADSPAIYVCIETTADDLAPLYRDWEPSAVEALRAALGDVPAWSVSCDISGRVPGDVEIRALVLELLAEGGVALDDFSDHCWTAAEIAEDRVVDGLRFFDYRTSFERDRGLGH